LVRELRNNPGNNYSFLNDMPLPWACAALRELLGGCLGVEGGVIPTPKWCRSACAALLGDVTKRSVDCVLKEFASLDELSADRSADASRTETRVADALAAVPAGNDAIMYVRAVAPQLANLLAKSSADSNTSLQVHAAHGRVALSALLQLQERGFDQMVVNSLRGRFGDVTDESSVAKSLCALGAASREGSPGLRVALAADHKILTCLLRLVAFARRSDHDTYIREATTAIKLIVRESKEPAKCILDAVLRPCKIRWTAGPRGGIKAVEGEKLEDVDWVDVFKALGAPGLVGSVFALCLSRFLSWRKNGTSDISTVGPTLKLVVGLAAQLDEGVIRTSGTDIITTVGIILSDVAKDDETLIYDHRNASKEEDEGHALEVVALGAVLGILEVGVADHSVEYENALKRLLPALATLSSPLRQMSSISEVAARCCALIICRDADARSKTEVLRKKINSNSDGTKAVLAEVATNLTSSLPALRAFGVVQLGKLCKQYTLDRDHFAFIQDAIMPKPLAWHLIADVILKALEDSESYVYLAAAHALAAVADANPREVLPWLQHSLESSSDDTIKLRLGETLMIAIRRRGEAAPAYAAILSRSLCYGARHDRPIAIRTASLSLLGELCGVARQTAHTFALDLCDLVANTLTMAQENQAVQRAASYLGYRALAGCGRSLLTAAPRTCAVMCKRIRKHALTSTDKITRSHANDALHALDALLADILYGDAHYNAHGAVKVRI